MNDTAQPDTDNDIRTSIKRHKYTNMHHIVYKFSYFHWSSYNAATQYAKIKFQMPTNDIMKRDWVYGQWDPYSGQSRQIPKLITIHSCLQKCTVYNFKAIYPHCVLDNKNHSIFS